MDFDSAAIHAMQMPINLLILLESCQGASLCANLRKQPKHRFICFPASTALHVQRLAQAKVCMVVVEDNQLNQTLKRSCAEAVSEESSAGTSFIKDADNGISEIREGTGQLKFVT